MPNYSLRDIQWIVNSPGFGRPDNTAARQMRNDVQADWINDFMEKMSGQIEDQKPVVANTHSTVASMVEELKQRVGLDGLAKKASVKIPLSKFAVETPIPTLTPELAADMQTYLTNYHLKPSHGQLGAEACYDALKEKYGAEKVSAIGRDSLMKLIEKARADTAEPNIIDSLPQYNGQPIPLKEESEDNRNQLSGKAH